MSPSMRDFFDTKKLDNRNQEKIQKYINNFSWFLLHAENP